jgi:hypothetical protein
VKRVSAADLIDKPVVCPTCGDPAMLRRDDQGYWLDCQGKHRPVVNVLGETLLEAIEPGEEEGRERRTAETVTTGRTAEQSRGG